MAGLRALEIVREVEVEPTTIGQITVREAIEAAGFKWDEVSVLDEDGDLLSGSSLVCAQDVLYILPFKIDLGREDDEDDEDDEDGVE